MQISVAKAKNNLPELIKAIEGGEPLTICRRGVPVVNLVPMKNNAGQEPGFGTLRGRVTINDPDWWKPMSEDDAEAFLDGPRTSQ
jgi:prevent-host-death family protein